MRRQTHFHDLARHAFWLSRRVLAGSSRFLSKTASVSPVVFHVAQAAHQLSWGNGGNEEDRMDRGAGERMYKIAVDAQRSYIIHA